MVPINLVIAGCGCKYKCALFETSYVSDLDGFISGGEKYQVGLT